MTDQERAREILEAAFPSEKGWNQQAYPVPMGWAASAWVGDLYVMTARMYATATEASGALVREWNEAKEATC